MAHIRVFFICKIKTCGTDRVVRGVAVSVLLEPEVEPIYYQDSWRS